MKKQKQSAKLKALAERQKAQKRAAAVAARASTGRPSKIVPRREEL